MTTKTCRVCTRTMDESQFRVLRFGNAQKMCRQCERDDRRALKQRHRNPPPYVACPLNLALRQWLRAA